MPYANNFSEESTLNGTTKTITFPWKPKTLQVTNDSISDDLQFKFNSSETYRTLKPYETYTGENISIRNLYLSTSASVAYRVWGTG